MTVLCPGPVGTNIVGNSRITQPAALNAEEAKTWEAITDQVTAMLARGVTPDEVGEMVLAAVKENRLYVHTDRVMEKYIIARTKALLDALPPVS